MCNFCKVKTYIQVERYAKSALAPLTQIEELEQELVNKTGLEYIQLKNRYCPMCGRKLGDKNE